MEAVNFNRLAYFTAVVETGSFTRAAERLGITKTVVSQQVAKLEEELKTSLLLRTTRRVEATEAGKLLYARCVLILRDAEDAVMEVGQANSRPVGTLRIAAPNDYGTSVVAPLVAEFCNTWPDCFVELILADARIDMVANHIDFAVRVGWLDDSSLQARRIGTFRQLLVATPEVAKALAIETPEDLARCAFIANGALKEPQVLRFSRNDFERQTVRMRAASTINSTPAVLAATLGKGGLSVLPDFLVTDYLASGALTHVLPEWVLPSGGIHVVYPAARFRPSKVTRFVELLMRTVTRTQMHDEQSRNSGNMPPR